MWLRHLLLLRSKICLPHCLYLRCCFNHRKLTRSLHHQFSPDHAHRSPSSFRLPESPTTAKRRRSRFSRRPDDRVPALQMPSRPPNARDDHQQLPSHDRSQNRGAGERQKPDLPHSPTSPARFLVRSVPPSPLWRLRCLAQGRVELPSPRKAHSTMHRRNSQIILRMQGRAREFVARRPELPACHVENAQVRVECSRGFDESVPRCS